MFEASGVNGMIRWIAVLALLPLSTDVVEAEEQISLPHAPPPRISIARFGEKGDIEFLDMVSHRRARAVPRMVGDGNDARPIVYTRVRRIEPERVRVFNVEGDEIQSKSLSSLLSVAKAVLVSADGRPVDPWYLKLVKEDTLIFVLPDLLPPDPSPSVSLSPPPLLVPPQITLPEEYAGPTLTPVESAPPAMLAEEPRPVRAVTDEGGFAVKLVQITTRRALPDDLPQEARPYNETAGYDLTFLVEGPNLTAIKPFSLTLETLKTKDGKDIRVVQGKASYRQESVHSEVYQGKYGFFRLVSDERLFGEIGGLQVQGAITLVVADGSETIRSEPLDLTKVGKTSLGEFKITLAGEVQPGPSLFDGLARAFGAPQDSTHLAFSVDGNLDTIANIDVRMGNKKLLWRSSSQSGNHAEYAYQKAGDGNGVIEITYWKDLREVRVPFGVMVPLGDE